MSTPTRRIKKAEEAICILEGLIREDTTGLIQARLDGNEETAAQHQGCINQCLEDIREQKVRITTARKEMK